MPVEEVRVPRAGESISEGTLNRWLKPDGSFVKVDEPRYELGTDKATQEVAAPVSGVLKIVVQEGQTVEVGAVVATINTDVTAPQRKPAPVEAAPANEAKKPEPAPKASPAKPEPERPRGGPEAIPSPGAARVLAEANLKPADVTGTGPGGRITKGDALAAAPRPAGMSGIGDRESEKNGPAVPASVDTRDPTPDTR